MRLVFPKSNRILCLDVALCNIGVAVWEVESKRFSQTGCLETSREAKQRGIYVADDNFRRCSLQAFRLGTIIQKVKPRCVFAELPFGGSFSASAASALGMSLGFIGAVSALAPITVRTFRPSETKKLVTGTNKASKDQVINFIRSRFGSTFFEGKPKGHWEHIADAMALIPVSQKNGLYQKELLLWV